MNLQEIKNQQNSQTNLGTAPNISLPTTMPKKPPTTQPKQTEQTTRTSDMETMISAMNRKILQLKNELLEEIKLNLKLNEEIKNIPRLPKDYGQTMEDYRKTKQSADELQTKLKEAEKLLNRKNGEILDMKNSRTKLFRETADLKSRISKVEAENEDLTAVVKCDEQYINYVNSQLKTERQNYQKLQGTIKPNFSRKILTVLMLTGLALNSTCTRLDFISFMKTTGKITALFLSGINRILLSLASLLPYKILQIIVAIPIFIIAYVALFLILCGAATGLYVLFRKYHNKLMEKIMLYTTTVFFIFADVLNINGHIGLNSVLLIFLINIGIFIAIALKRYNKDDCNSYNFKENIIKFIDKLESLEHTQKPKKNSPDINKETISSKDIAELVRKKYASRPSPIEPKSDFAKAVKTIYE